MTWLTAKMIEQKADESAAYHARHLRPSLKSAAHGWGASRADSASSPVARARSVDPGAREGVSKTYKPSVPRARRRPAYARIEQYIRAR